MGWDYMWAWYRVKKQKYKDDSDFEYVVLGFGLWALTMTLLIGALFLA